MSSQVLQYTIIADLRHYATFQHCGKEALCRCLTYVEGEIGDYDRCKEDFFAEFARFIARIHTITDGKEFRGANGQWGVTPYLLRTPQNQITNDPLVQKTLAELRSMLDILDVCKIGVYHLDLHME